VLVPAYPKHRLDGLKDVLFELCAMEPDENGLAAILAHLENWKRCEEWMKEGGRFVPNMGKWFTDHKCMRDPPFSSNGNPSVTIRTPEDYYGERRA
jgi:hypothetical protein